MGRYKIIDTLDLETYTEAESIHEVIKNYIIKEKFLTIEILFKIKNTLLNKRMHDFTVNDNLVARLNLELQKIENENKNKEQLIDTFIEKNIEQIVNILVNDNKFIKICPC